jgi:hypothetical protein
MNHTFNIYYAKKYGLNEAIMISNFQFWIVKNKANGTHQYDDRTWTYNSVKAFEELFPYLKPSQIRRCIESLIEQGILIKGEYNKNPYDRTSWFAFADESTFINEQLDLSNLTNGDVKFANSHTDSKPDNKKEKSIKKEKKATIEERKEWLKKQLEPFLEKYGRQVLNEFYLYWTEPNETGNKIRYESQKFFDISRRLSTWASRNETRGKFAAPSVRPAQNTSALCNQDNHSNYADYVAWCERHNAIPEPERP